jgi:hypothetical protein
LARQGHFPESVLVAWILKGVGFCKPIHKGDIMMIARWRVEARFGHKSKVVDLLKKWDAEIAPQVGLEKSQMRTVTGSVGAAESVIEQEFKIEGLTELDEIFKKMATAKGHPEWGEELEPFVVSGSSRWEIFRII